MKSTGMERALSPAMLLNAIRRVLALWLVLLCVVAHAQRTDGTLRGVVQDPEGAVVGRAKVTVLSTLTGVTYTTETTDAGTYVFPNLPVGTYTLTVEGGGFQKYARKGIEVRSSQVAEADVRLVIGSADTMIEVQAGAEVVETQSSQLAASFQQRAVNELPIASLGGSPLELSVLLPNTTTVVGGVVGDGGSVGGTRARANGFTIDGVDNNDIVQTGALSPVINEAVAEFSLITNQYAAEYGFAGGGQFNVVTKSGTNDWHGEGHYFNRNRDLNARTNLEEAAGLTDPARDDYNRVGGSLGGPLVKNRLFLFGAYEYQTQGVASTGVQVLAPTAAGLSALNSLAASSAVRGLLAQFPAASSATTSETVTDPATGNPVVIPIGPAQTFAPNFFNQHDFQINVDANLGAHQVRGRLLYDRFRSPNVNLNLPLAQFAGQVVSDNRKVFFTDVWAISTRLVNDFRASYSRNVADFTVPGQFANFPDLIIDSLGLNVGPEPNSPQGVTQNVYQVLEQVAYSRGAHTFKFGGEWRHWIAPSDFLPRARGEFDYANLNELVNDFVPTGFNGALRGVGSGFFAGNQNAIFWFVQDDFKLTPHLTLNLGLRYEWVGIPRDAQLQAINDVASDPSIGLFFRAPRTDTNNFAPRIGFAWDPTGSGKWALRGGFGISYYNTFQNLVLLQLPPQLQGEQNPALTCSGLSGPPPAWCASFLDPNDGTGRGFLAGGGLAQVNLPPTDQAAARANTQSLIEDQVQPKILSWSLGVQREVTPNTSLEVRYVGTRSLSLPVQVRRNFITVFEAAPQLGSLPVFFSASDVPATFDLNASTRADFENAQTLRFLNQGFFGTVTAFPATGSSIYHAGSADLNHRFSQGLTLRGNYTFAHNIDNATNELFSSRVNPRRPQDPNNIAGERGRSALDIRHKFALSWIYEVPKLNVENRIVRSLLHGWQFSGTYLAQSGQPITALSGVDANGDFDAAGDRAILNGNGTSLSGTAVDFVLRDPGTGATSICSSNCPSDQTVGYVAVDPSARFVRAELGAVSNLGRNTVSTPGLNIWNTAVFKTTKLSEGVNIQLRVETFNTFNHRNFSLAAPTVFSALDPQNALSTSFANVSSPNFLNIRQFDGGARTLQLGLKLTF